MSRPVENEAISVMNASSSDPASSQAAQVNSSPTENRNPPQKYTFLTTAITLLSNAYGVPVPFRVILDIRSHENFITEEAAQLLGLPTTESNNQVLINGRVLRNLQEVALTIRSRNPLYSSYKKDISCLILPEMPKPLPSDIDWSASERLPSHLADPEFHRAGKIDMILGSDVTLESLLSDTQDLSNGAFLKDSIFGWIVAGSIETFFDLGDTMVIINPLISFDENLPEVPLNENPVVETNLSAWGWDRDAKSYYE